MNNRNGVEKFNTLLSSRFSKLKYQYMFVVMISYIYTKQSHELDI